MAPRSSCGGWGTRDPVSIASVTVGNGRIGASRERAIGAAGKKTARTEGAGAPGVEKIWEPRGVVGSGAGAHHEGLKGGVQLADPCPGTRGSGHDVLLRVAAVTDHLLELLDARLLDVRGLLQVLNLPIHGDAVGLAGARPLVGHPW